MVNRRLGFIIAGSGPLAIRDLREARDIDILVNASLWDELLLNYIPQGAKKNYIVFGEIEVWKDWMILTDRVEEMVKDCDVIDGFPFMKLDYVLETKRYTARPKDVQDIELIEIFLAHQIL